jgi:hypothetical protein
MLSALHEDVAALRQELRSKSAMLATQLSAQLESQVSGGVTAVLLAARQEQRADALALNTRLIMLQRATTRRQRSPRTNHRGSAH